jgi:structural maintenance of chromosome 3 (chondroitin sulfate proteoglycan 6)
LETAKTEKQHALGQQQDALSNLRRTIGKEVKEIAACTQQVTEKANDAASLQKQMDEKKRQRSVLQEARQEAWRTANELSDKVGEARDTFHRSRSNCRKSMPRNTAMGIDALKTIVEQERLTSDQYFGMLLDNMELKNERYTTAVEVAAQNSLFHVIVDTDATAARLMKRLEEEKLGRVTFLPLNQLRVDTSVKYPTQTSDVRPLLDSCINYDKRVDRAMQHVFGKKLLAKTPEIASEWSTKVSMDTITLEGDLCSRKGALTGGYVDATKSRLRAYKQQQEAKQALTLMEKDFQKANQEAQKVDQETTNLVSELQRLEAQRGKLSQMVAGKETDLERLEARLEAHTKQADNVEKTTIPPLERGIIAIEADIARLQEEIGTELQETLSENDRELLAELKKVQADLIPQIEAKSDEVAQVGVKRTTLKSLLEDNLLKRRKELAEGVSGDVDEGQRLSRGRLSSAGLEAQHTEELEERQQELSDAIRIKEEIESRLDKARETNDELRGELLSAKNELEQLTSHDLTNKKALEEAQDKSERLLNKVRLARSLHV